MTTSSREPATARWTWRLFGPDGGALEPGPLGVTVAVEDAQSEAESWLGENWRDLLERGVASASLLRGDDVVYGPMGLSAS